MSQMHCLYHYLVVITVQWFFNVYDGRFIFLFSFSQYKTIYLSARRVKFEIPRLVPRLLGSVGQYAPLHSLQPHHTVITALYLAQLAIATTTESGNELFLNSIDIHI